MLEMIVTKNQRDSWLIAIIITKESLSSINLKQPLDRIRFTLVKTTITFLLLIFREFKFLVNAKRKKLFLKGAVISLSLPLWTGNYSESLSICYNLEVM
jgi:hypothetical protein